ncbi:MAG: BrnT family toxin [Verrucomicrobiota bacterium]|nr:BrnT family toxin [Verrucomicrobiota bacterium]
MRFEWDERKARSNATKHSVSFDDASTIFADALSLTIRDPDHSQVENRFVTVGRAHRGELLVVVHTERGDNIRLISARPASRRERRTYEEGQ